MNAPKGPRRLSARRDDPLPSLPAPSGSLSFNSASSAPRGRFAAFAEKKSDSHPSSSMGGFGSSLGAAATPHKVWLGSLPSALKERDLRERLACFGTIQSFFFRPEQPGATALPPDHPQHNKKARGWAFVSYATAEEAQALIKAMDGKSPDTVFHMAGLSLLASGAVSPPPIEARLANDSKNTTGTLGASSTNDSRTIFSEEDPSTREKLLAVAFFSPSSKPAGAGRASSLAPPSAGASASATSNSSSTRCSSHPRVANNSSVERADPFEAHESGITPISGHSSERSGQATGSRPLNSAAVRGQRSKLAALAALAEQQKQQAKLAIEETPALPQPTSFPLPPAGGGNFGLPQLSQTGKTTARVAPAGAAVGSGSAAAGASQTHQQAAAAASPAAGEAAPTAATCVGGSTGARSVPTKVTGSALNHPSVQEQQQPPAASDGSGVGTTAAAAGVSQRGKRVYGGLHAAAFPSLSAAAAMNTGGSSRTQQQPSKPDAPGLPSLWEVYWTPDTHQPYYYNAISKHVQWERPLPPRDYVEQYGDPMTEELGPPAPLIPGVTRGIVAGKGGAVVGPLGSNLFVFHLPPEWSEETFLRHFAPFGNVVSCKIQINAQTGKRGGFGFVSYDNPASAIASIRMLNGFAACGKMLKVQLKKGEEHLLPPDLLQQQQQQQQHHQQQHPPPAPPVGFTWSAGA